MKIKFLVSVSAAALAVGLTSNTAPVQAYGMAGCGLGSLIIKQDGPAQIFAATSNATSGNQTTGMTFGTLNCPKGQALISVKEAEQRVFVAVNYTALEQEMAIGRGEKLTAFSKMLGCESADSFGAMTRSNYTRFFSETQKTEPNDLLTSIRSEVAAGNAGNCSL
jgi:hypothetical protein